MIKSLAVIVVLVYAGGLMSRSIAHHYDVDINKSTYENVLLQF